MPRYSHPTAVDLFAGCGGFSLGFHKAGLHPVAAVEFSLFAAMTYITNLGSPATRIYASEETALQWNRYCAKERKQKVGKRLPVEFADLEQHGDYYTWPGAGSNGWLYRAGIIRDHKLAGTFNEGMLTWNGEAPANDFIRELNDIPDQACLEPVQSFYLLDVRTLTGSQILESVGLAPGEVDAVCGGPPCQGFSNAGRRDIMDPRNSLVFDFARLVCEMRPKTFVMENVPGMASMKTPEGTPVIDALARVFEDGGFASYDAMRSYLQANAGARCATRGSSKVSRSSSKKTGPAASDLFAEALV